MLILLPIQSPEHWPENKHRDSRVLKVYSSASVCRSWYWLYTIRISHFLPEDMSWTVQTRPVGLHVGSWLTKPVSSTQRNGTHFWEGVGAGMTQWTITSLVFFLLQRLQWEQEATLSQAPQLYLWPSTLDLEWIPWSESSACPGMANLCPWMTGLIL